MAISSRTTPTAVSVIALAVALSAATPVAYAATDETVTFGDFDVWVVPEGVTSVTIELTGGDGGTATASTGTSAIGQGGRGGVVSAVLPVVPGDELSFRIATAGAGVDISTAPLGTAAVGTGDGSGGEGWATGGGSSSLRLNGELVAGAPGGGGGGALMVTGSSLLFSSAGGDGGSNAPDVVDGATVLLTGSLAGANPVNPINDGRAANTGFGVSGGVRVSAEAAGAGGAGWPGGDAQSVAIDVDGPEIIYAASGGGGGAPFLGQVLIDAVADVKADGAGRDGSAQVTFTRVDASVGGELAATGPHSVGVIAGLGLMVLLAGAGAVAYNRRRAIAQQTS